MLNLKGEKEKYSGVLIPNGYIENHLYTTIMLCFYSRKHKVLILKIIFRRVTTINPSCCIITRPLVLLYDVLPDFSVFIVFYDSNIFLLHNTQTKRNLHASVIVTTSFFFVLHINTLSK